jgi:hypothetical protein
MDNETHVEFHDETGMIVEQKGAGALGVTAQYTGVYLPAKKKEAAHLDIIRNSKWTPKLKRVDVTRRDSYRGLRSSLKLLTRHPVAAIREAATELLRIVKSYGDIDRRGYDAESATSNDLLRELDLPENKELVAIAGVADWVEQLRAANKLFVEYMLERYEELGQRPDTPMKELRVATDDALDDLLDRVEAMIVLNGIDYTTALAPFVAEFNALVERYKHVLAQAKGRRAAAKDKEEEEEEEL